MPNIAFVGDVHGQLVSMYSRLMQWMERTGVKIDGVIQVGDLGVFGGGDRRHPGPVYTDWSVMWNNGAPAPMPTWVVMGNHEDPAMIKAWQGDPGRIPGMTLLPDGGITDVLGVLVASVWGNYSPKSWLNPERVVRHRAEAGEGQSRYSVRIAQHISRSAVDRLLEMPGPIDVLVTHDSATMTLPIQFRGGQMDPVIKELLGLTPEENPGGCPGFNELLAHFKPKEYFFGHLHTYQTGKEGDTNWTCLNAIDYGSDRMPWFEVRSYG